MNNNTGSVNTNESGMLTSIWGNSTWNSLHCISFTYPEHPSKEDKQHYKIYFQTLKYVLPCCVCRKHYTEHTQIGGDFEITDEVFDNKTTLTLWLYELHKHVNKSLGMVYDITYDDVCTKYNSYIANCNMSTEKKIIAYKNAHDQEAPFVPYETAILFSDYAAQRGITDFVDKLNTTFKHFKTKRDSENNISENWIKRNVDCLSLSKYMRTNGIIGFEKNTDHHNLPTVEELQMLQMMSTTLSDTTLKHMIEKLHPNVTMAETISITDDVDESRKKVMSELEKIEMLKVDKIIKLLLSENDNNLLENND